MDIADKPKTNFTPMGLKYRGFSDYGFNPDNKPTFNDNFNAVYDGLLAGKNRINLLNTGDVQSNDASNIVGGRQFDAVVDINGKGDFLSIQDAITAGKKRIFVRAGNYNIDSKITIDKTVIIIGEHRNDVILSNNGFTNDPIIEFSYTTTAEDGIRIENITFDGNDQVGSNGIELDDTNYTAINNCYFKDFAGTAIISTQTTRDAVISNCIFSGCENCISFDGAASDFQVRITITLCIFDSIGDTAIYLGEYTQTCSISSNYFQCISVSDSSKFIHLEDGAYSSTGHKIVNNFFLAVGGVDSPLLHLDGSGVHYNYIVGNFFQCGSSFNAHIVHLNASGYNIFSNNIINANVTDNDDTYSGVYIENTSTYNIISGNNINSTNGTYDLKYGIREASVNDDYNNIFGNIVQGCATANISTQGANTITTGSNIA